MAIVRWEPRNTITRQEEYLLKRCRTYRKLFAFLRHNRDVIFDYGFQEELEAMHESLPRLVCDVFPPSVTHA